MTSEADNTVSKHFAGHIQRIFSWRRLRLVAITSAVVFLLFAYGWQISRWILIGRLLFFGLCALLAFGVVEVWPRKLPRWLARWALQVAAVALVIPLAVWIGYSVTNMGLDVPWWRDKDRLEGYATFTFLGMLLAPWLAVAALLKQIKNDAQNQALAFELERSQLEKQALDARLNLLQAQIQPHFLFNTLANVRELVISRSPQAAIVLEHLIAYLRAAVPRLNDSLASMAQELELVHAYLSVMQMRLPDRLQFALHIDPAVNNLFCPPMTLLTLVENAMRHGIDPCEDGGRIDLFVNLQNQYVHAKLIDTGKGLANAPPVFGMGLTNLRERLQLIFGRDANVSLAPHLPQGTCAEVRFTAKFMYQEKSQTQHE